MIITLPELNPNLLTLGPIAIRWYSLAYIAGVLFAMLMIKKANHNNNVMSQKAYDDWLFWIVLSILIGGRLGYVFFYNPFYYLHNPLEIFAIWQGGMSFHGGLAGVIIGMFLFSKKYQIQFWKLMDILAVAVPIGLFFGRIANFINMELYGRVTNSNYGIIFPNAGDLPRHPSQLYEAALEGILTFIILFSFYKFTKLKEKTGVISGLFLICYGCFRILIENFREPDQQIGFLFGQITMGQLLSLPLIICGMILVSFRLRKKKFIKI